MTKLTGVKVGAAVRRKKKAPMRSPAIDLLNAVGAWVKSRGGEVLVAGGVQIQRWPQDPDHTFLVAVRCTGRAPVPDAPKDPAVTP